jgi:AcrR family transcriptional regulator
MKPMVSMLLQFVNIRVILYVEGVGMRKTKAATDETRQAILAAALRVFSRRGYAATRLDDIGQEAGVTRGAVYWHFKTKAELYTAIVSEAYAQLDTVLTTAWQNAPTFTESVRQVILSYFQHVQENSTFRAALEISLFKTEATEELAEGFHQKQVGIRESLAGLRQLIINGQQNGEFRLNLHPEWAALSCLSLLHGVVELWLVDVSAFSLTDAAPELAALFLQSIIVR